MAKKSANKDIKQDKRVKLTNWKDFTFVLNNLNDEELSALDQTEFDPERYMDFMEMCIEKGMSIKADWDNYSDCIQVSATGAWAGYQNQGISVTARSMELWDAYKILWFKVVIIADWDLEQFVNKSPTRGKRG